MLARYRMVRGRRPPDEAANPDVSRCHTVLALVFMKRLYRSLRVVLPPGVSPR